MEEVKKEKGEVYLCPNCGGHMIFNIKKQKLCCEYCETEALEEDEFREIREYDLEKDLRREVLNWGKESKVLKCKGCGAEVVLAYEETVKECSFCGSSHITDGNSDNLIKPEAVLPFKVDLNKAQDILVKWMSTRYLAPNDLKNLYSSEKMKGIYVPYWTYDANTSSFYIGQGGIEERYTVVEDGKEVSKVRVKWYSVSGNIKLFFDDVQVNASKNFNEFLINKIEPFNMEKLVPYNEKYLSGYIAEKYTKDIKTCFEIAKRNMRADIKKEAKKNIRRKYDKAKIDSLDVKYNQCKYKHILIPVWTAKYTYNGKEYTYIINGESGKVSGSIPYSKVKIAIIILIIIIVIILVVVMGGR